MDDHLAMIARIFQEFLADPAQIGQRLLVERHAGPDAGVDEGILADLDHILSHATELNMRLRYEVRHPPGDLPEGGGRIAPPIPPNTAPGGIPPNAPEKPH